MKKGDVTLGFREIVKGVKAGSIKKVVVANNCPKSMVDRLGNVRVEIFDGDQTQLGTKLGKPFPVAMAGFRDMYAEFK